MPRTAHRAVPVFVQAQTRESCPPKNAKREISLHLSFGVISRLPRRSPTKAGIWWIETLTTRSPTSFGNLAPRPP
jgi:hypothetical protein